MKLCDLSPGQSGCVIWVPESLKIRLGKMGFIKGSVVRCLFRAPMGDPTAYLVKGAAVALRQNDAVNIEVDLCD